MSRATTKKTRSPEKADPRQPAWSAFRLPLYEDQGPTVTISASIPESLAAEVRDAVGSREFSQFVAQAMRREMLRMNRQRLVDEIEAVSGPVDPAEIERISRLMQ